MPGAFFPLKVCLYAYLNCLDVYLATMPLLLLPPVREVLLQNKKSWLIWCLLLSDIISSLWDLCSCEYWENGSIELLWKTYRINRRNCIVKMAASFAVKKLYIQFYSFICANVRWSLLWLHLLNIFCADKSYR